jgi:hypothetical protein
MRVPLRSTALGLALAAGASAANAQTVITRPVIDPPLVTVPATAVQPMQTIQTTETTRTVRPAPRNMRRQIVTTRTVTRQRLVPASTVVARTVTTAPRTLYDVAAPGPVVTTSDDDYAPRLYDEVTTAPAAAPFAGPVVQDQYTTPFFYRYVYEPDRILVIDPNTGVAVQSIPR